MDQQARDEQAFGNAELVEVESAEEFSCGNCEERVVFWMKDKEHTFPIGLTTLLRCLEFAIENGDLPKLPESWRDTVWDAFGLRMEDNTVYPD